MQVQNIPCRVLALVGMQDGAFPRQKRVPAWDLLHLDPRPWDRNARVDDRQLFLDAVLTPSERLIITAGSRNVHTGKSEPFSACVDELLRTAQEMGAPRNILVVEHRLQPFSPGYFAEGNGEDDLPRSFDARSARIANSFSTRPTGTETAPPFWTPDNIRKEIVSCGKSKEISVEQLIGFWKDPARALLRAAGVTLPFDEESDQALDRAPVEMNSLQQWNVKQAILQEMLSGRNSLECTRALLQAGRSLPPAAMGKLRWDALRTQVEPLGNGLLQSRREPLLVEHELEAGGAVLVLTGTIPRAEAAGENFLLACRAGTFKTAKDYLDPWIRSIVAAAEGCTHRTLVMDEKNTGPMLQFKAHEQAGAREQLQFLLAGFLEGQERPLCYAPLTSEVYAQKCQAWDATDLDALTAASSAWNKEGFDNQPSGEGWSAAASIVWRNQNPFALAAQWHQWAHDIARPLLAWRDPGKAEDR
jgi:exodeoxyribonuclease V gamma subunit